jgi:LAO/AO transport system kinase
VTHPLRPRLARDEYIDGILHGDRAILARAITLIESTRIEDDELGGEILEACLPHTGNSKRMGITGVPGAGKSSVIEALGMHLTRERGEKLAVLAVDPSSRISGGSILGDKTRMESLSVNDLAFIRPSPSSGSLGGVARRTRESMLLCEAAGYSNIIVETIGVGQSETAVHSMVDFFLLLMITGAGDELQGMKRGILEMADLVAINKADGTNRETAQRTCRELELALHLFPAPLTGWRPHAVTCSAKTGEGIVELWDNVLKQHELLKANGWFQRIRNEQAKEWMHDIVQQTLLRNFREHPAIRTRLPILEQQVAEGRISSFRAASDLLKLFSEA